MIIKQRSCLAVDFYVRKKASKKVSKRRVEKYKSRYQPFYVQFFSTKKIYDRKVISAKTIIKNTV